jgi:signal transduction histidine kinase
MSTPDQVPGSTSARGIARKEQRLPIETTQSEGHAATLRSARPDVVAAVFHDLRAPLSAIQAVADAVEDGVLAQDTLDWHFRRLRLLAERLVRLTDDLVIAGDAPAVRSEAVGDIIDEALAAVETGAQQRLELRCTAAARGARVRACRPRVLRALDNLLVNAVRHTPASQAVRLSARIEQASVCFEVADRCGGIASVDLLRLFEVGHRGEGGGSAGLGLPIVAWLVESQGGAVTARNQRDGCCFQLRLPRA